MRRQVPNEIIDAEFREIPTSWLGAWRLQLPRSQDRIAYVLATLAAAAVVAGVFAGQIVAGFVAGLVLVGIASLLTEEHKSKGLAALVVAIMLTASGCSDTPEMMDETHSERTPAEVQQSIRQATEYRDPREGFTPKPLAVPGAVESPEKNDDSR